MLLILLRRSNQPSPMNEEKVASIIEHQKDAPTERLLSIWVEHDTDEWQRQNPASKIACIYKKGEILQLGRYSR